MIVEGGGGGLKDQTCLPFSENERVESHKAAHIEKTPTRDEENLYAREKTHTDSQRRTIALTQ